MAITKDMKIVNNFIFDRNIICSMYNIKFAMQKQVNCRNSCNLVRLLAVQSSNCPGTGILRCSQTYSVLTSAVGDNEFFRWMVSMLKMITHGPSAYDLYAGFQEAELDFVLLSL